MAKVARLYYEQNHKQSHIAEQLNISQATISRLLKRAEKEQIVRISVNIPHTFHADLEQQLEEHFGLQEVVVVDCSSDDDASIQLAIGAAAAYYLETTLGKQEVIGISSWSSTLLRTVEAMSPINKKSNPQVVQLLGGIGNPSAEVHANQLTQKLASRIGGEAVFLPAPGVVGSAESLQVMLDDPFVKAAMDLFENITIALVGIGGIEPSKLLVESGNVFSEHELERLQVAGAVGDICLRFYDRHGVPVETELDHRVISIQLDQLQNTERTIGVAGGIRKVAAIRGALVGKLVNVLITDIYTARELVNELKN